MTTNSNPLEQLNKLQGSKTVIVGIGNTLKGDDGAGPLVCQKLMGKVAAEVVDAGTVPENYVGPIIKKTPQTLIIIDAIDFGASPGTLSIFRPDQLDSFVFSTHALSPHMFVDPICQQTNPDVFFIGIQPEHTRLGEPICAPVQKAVQQLAQTLIAVFALQQ
ncbi:MAG: hydrogenase 3 maturation endopeptidase HyCI [Phycisphaerales bacterium]|nr:MAG: hydrogenase 3 maturation endopeptidase HyCI [Phycisphaerales bacterium]